MVYELSLNVSETKYSFFHKTSKRDDIPLLLPKLNISYSEIERSECLKFLGVLLDENLCWKEDIKYIEIKIAKNIVLLFKKKPDIDKHSPLSLYHCYIHSYMNYGNIAGGSTTRTNLKKIYRQQKLTIPIVYSKDRLTHTRELFKECKVLNVYPVSIGKILFLCIKLTQVLSLQFFWTNLKSPPTITHQTSLELIIVYHLLN